MNRRIIPLLFQKIALVAMLTGLVPAMDLSSVAFAQTATAESLMAPTKGTTAGVLERGELLVTALRHENVDATSARLAIQSISKLFDFRLTRSGDKYLFKVNGNRKLTMLRYQRAEHIYEAVLNPETGEYEARLLDVAQDVPAVPDVSDTAGNQNPEMNDEDGEVDVERAAFGQDGTNAGSDDFDRANPDDPVQPVDPALAGVKSPDAEYDDSDELPGDGSAAPNADVQNNNGLQPWNEENLRDDQNRVPDSVNDTEDTNQDTPELQNLPGTSTPIVEPNVNVRPKRVNEHESVTFSMVSLVMFILGLGALGFALIAIIVPAYRVRRRCAANGMAIRDMLTVAPDMRIARLSVDNHECIVAIHAKDMSFIAPCPPDDEALWEHIKSKVYWYQMSQTPVSDRQMVGLIKAFYDNKEHAQTHEKSKDSRDSSDTKSEIISENSIYSDPEYSEDDLSEDNVFSKLEVTYRDADDEEEDEYEDENEEEEES